jgi:hypothetical protein
MQTSLDFISGLTEPSPSIGKLSTDRPSLQGVLGGPPVMNYNCESDTPNNTSSTSSSRSNKTKVDPHHHGLPPSLGEHPSLQASSSTSSMYNIAGGANASPVPIPSSSRNSSTNSPGSSPYSHHQGMVGIPGYPVQMNLNHHQAQQPPPHPASGKTPHSGSSSSSSYPYQQQHLPPHQQSSSMSGAGSSPNSHSPFGPMPSGLMNNNNNNNNNNNSASSSSSSSSAAHLPQGMNNVFPPVQQNSHHQQYPQHQPASSSASVNSRSVSTGGVVGVPLSAPSQSMSVNASPSASNVNATPFNCTTTGTPAALVDPSKVATIAMNVPAIKLENPKKNNNATINNVIPQVNNPYYLRLSNAKLSIILTPIHYVYNLLVPERVGHQART